SGVLCNGIDIASQPWGVQTAAQAATTTFTITFAPQIYCARVQIAKWVNSKGSVSTTVVSRGYNDGCDPGPADRIERASQSNY
ncbi:MAG TPA: hypothetical protein VF803_01605, partial [Candidatus Paceibacterota bacterium]